MLLDPPKRHNLVLVPEITVNPQFFACKEAQHANTVVDRHTNDWFPYRTASLNKFCEIVLRPVVATETQATAVHPDKYWEFRDVFLVFLEKGLWDGDIDMET
jgi:hypothetical protein